MNLTVRVENEQFTIGAGSGHNYWLWVAHYAARLYSQSVYPQGNYIPCLLYLDSKNGELSPHPNERIRFILERKGLKPEDFVVQVWVRKANNTISDVEKNWECKAYGSQKHLICTKVSYRVANLNKNKDFFFKAKIIYEMSPEIQHLFSPKEYPEVQYIKLKDRQVSPNEMIFEEEIMLPLGLVTVRLVYFEKEGMGEEYREVDITDSKMTKEAFQVVTEPQYVSNASIQQLIAEEMKIVENISKSVQEKQMEAKKRNSSSSLCCFTFEQLWGIIEDKYGAELFLAEYQPSTCDRIKITLDKSMNGLYEIFFNYFIIENQHKDKKEELAITYQDVMHFLRDCGVLTDMELLKNFFKFYNADLKFKQIADTVDVTNFGVRFPQFITILFRAIQFLQTSTLLLKGETFDSAVAKVVEKVLRISDEEGELTEYRRNIRENHMIISYVRSISEQVKKIFVALATKSVQNSWSCFVLMKEEIKTLLINSSLAVKKTDQIVSDCFKALQIPYEGVFYYQFLIVLQWLAIATIISDKEDKEAQNVEEEALMIIEKMKFLVDKVKY